MNRKSFSIKNAVSDSEGEFALCRVDELVRKGMSVGRALYITGANKAAYEKHLKQMAERNTRRLDGTPKT